MQQGFGALNFAGVDLGLLAGGRPALLSGRRFISCWSARGIIG